MVMVKRHLFYMHTRVQFGSVFPFLQSWHFFHMLQEETTSVEKGSQVQERHGTDTHLRQDSCRDQLADQRQIPVFILCTTALFSTQFFSFFFFKFRLTSSEPKYLSCCNYNHHPPKWVLPCKTSNSMQITAENPLHKTRNPLVYLPYNWNEIPFAITV